jgi:hypothetical protein
MRVFLLNIVQCRALVDFDLCAIEQCEDTQNTSLNTSFNNTNQSSHLSNGDRQNNVLFLKQHLRR